MSAKKYDTLVFIGRFQPVKGSDNAIKAKFRELSEIRSEECFEDHYEIKQWAVGA